MNRCTRPETAARTQAGNRAIGIVPALVCILTLLFPLLLQAQPPEKPPRLVLQIAVDQLRGDLLNRYYAHFGAGGFRYLLENGTVYRDAHHAHANTETVVGHATLSTGAYPAVHGMIGNEWLDRARNQVTYCLEDDLYPLLTPAADGNSKGSAAPMTAPVAGEGRSPTRLLVSTFADELAIGTQGNAKVFAISVKDRGAIPMSGHAGKAFWFSKERGEFITSTYYYSAYPAWVNEWNALRRPFAYADTSWALLREPGQYLFGAADDRAFETDMPGFGRTFPHAYGPADGAGFTSFLTSSPAGDELTAEFAEALVENESLGQDEVPDYLSISFSSVDYIGHTFGPSSLESEDAILRLDRTLAELFAFIDRSIGLQRVLIVLSADHGTPEAPAYLREQGLDAGYVDLASWDWKPALAMLKKRFGVDGQRMIQKYEHPYVYLDQAFLQEHDLDPAAVAQVLAEQMSKFPHVWAAISSSALLHGQLADTKINRLVLQNLNPERSGDIYVIFAPNWFINSYGPVTITATHGSPWTYDTFVPLIFAGPGVPAREVFRPVQTIDVAPTLSAFVKVKMPSGASGKPLPEVWGLVGNSQSVGSGCGSRAEEGTRRRHVALWRRRATQPRCVRRAQRCGFGCYRPHEGSDGAHERPLLSPV